MSERIDRFLEQAHRTDPAAIYTLCAGELETLYNTYSDATVHKLVTQYRNALRATNLSPLFLVCMREWKNRSDGLRTHAKQARKARQTAQYPLRDVEGLIRQATVLLTSESYSAVMQGLALLTGRRPYELATTASFVPCDDKPLHVWFSGQAKTRDVVRAQQAYRIPFLTDPQTGCTALARLRHMRDFAPYAPGTQHANHTSPNTAFHDRFSKTFHETCLRYFGPLLPGAPLNPKALRKIYTVVCYDRFARPNESLQSYAADILGHGEDDLETPNAYQDFYLAVTE